MYLGSSSAYTNANLDVVLGVHVRAGQKKKKKKRLEAKMSKIIINVTTGVRCRAEDECSIAGGSA
jgi:hypothetical protein